jgi:hypothetical protein
MKVFYGNFQSFKFLKDFLSVIMIQHVRDTQFCVFGNVTIFSKFGKNQKIEAKNLDP